MTGRDGSSVHVCSAGAMRGVDAGNSAFMCAPLNVSNAIVDAGNQMTFTYDGSSHSVHPSQKPQRCRGSLIVSVHWT